MPRVGANIYKRKDGRWEARYVKTVLPNGKKKYGSVYARTYKEVREKQIACISMPRCVPGKAKPSTLSELMWIWLTSRLNAIKRSSYLKYESLIKNHLSTEIGQLPLDQISGTTIDQFANEKLNGSSPLSPKSVNDILTIVSLAYSFAVTEYGISKPTIRRVKEPRKEMRVLSRAEQTALEDYLLADIDLYKLGILLSLYSGIRVGELCALDWDDLSEGTLSVSKTLHRIKRGAHTVLEITEPKSKASVRKIPLPSRVNAIIETQRTSGRLIKGRNGVGVEPRVMQHYFKRVLTKCKIEDANFHSLRHTFATRCIEVGFDVKTLSEILGHTDVKTTLNRYVHSSFEQKKHNMEKLCAGVFEQGKPSE